MNHERFFNTQAESLTEAYHVIFDIKDRTNDNGIKYACYEALQKMAVVMELLKVTVPIRFDGDGRPA